MLVATWIAVISCLLTCVNAYPNLLFSTSKDIRVASVSESNKVVTIVKLQDLEEGAVVDFYHEGSLVCWTHDGLGMIQCISYNGTVTGTKVGVVATGLSSPAGLACDWLTQKLYWTDGETKRIEVATINGEHRKVLFWDDMDQPLAIAVAPMKSIIFWTDRGEVPKIERAGMNGDPATRKVIVHENIFWPYGLTVDFDAQLVYWLDGGLKFVEVMDYEGQNRRTMIKEGVNYPFALTVFQNKLYWTDWKTWSIHAYDKSSSAPPKEIIHGDYHPMDIHVWDAQRQPSGDNPCHHRNGRCSHLCLLAPYPPGYSCACPTGVKLLDNTTCANGPQEMLLLVQRDQICTISLDSPDYTNFVLPLTGIKNAIAIDYDPVDRYFYWTDDKARALQRAQLDGSGQENLIVTGVEYSDGVAVDWVARNLYWTDTGTDRIEVARLTGAFRKVLINEDLYEPRAIALAPEKGWMFWSDWNEKDPKIERAALDGSSRLRLIDKELGWPNGIALDLERDKIYWCDAKTQKIEVANMADGKDRREVISDSLPHLFGLSLLGDYLYLTDWERGSIDRIKITGNGREVIVDHLPNLMGLKAVQLEEVKGSNPCVYNNGNCSHLCLNRPHDYVCACQTDYELAANERTCVVPEAFLLFARKANIGRTGIENGNNDAVIPVTGVKDVSALDFDISDNRIYWTDVKVKAISRAFIDGSDVVKIVEFGLDSPEGMAVDWVAHNVYWTDTGSKRIEVARLDGCCRKVLIWKDIDEPRSLAVNPRDGFMYWSDWGSQACISRAAMDGTHRKLIIRKVGRASGLTVDYVQHRLYWTELGQHVIESSDLNGKKRAVVIGKNTEKPFGLAQYLDYIYWADWKTGIIERANKTDGSNRTVIHNKLEFITDILVFHTSRQSAWNQCAVGNGGCSHLCLALPAVSRRHGRMVSRQSSTHYCGCPTHYTLGHGSKTCIGPRSFLLFGQKNSLSRFLPDTDDFPYVVLPIHRVKNIKAVEFDPVSQFIYWIDGSAWSSIKRSYDNGTHAGPAFVPSSSTHFPFDMALDPYGRLLYWTCANTNAIYVTRLDSGSAVGVVVKADGEKPRNIALHPEKGLMFWTDVGSVPRILRAAMDGKSCVVIATHLENLIALAVDRIADLLFWAQPNQIESSDLDGKGRKVLVNTGLVQVSSLAVHGDYLYWVDKDQSQIERANKTDGSNRGTVLTRLAHLVYIVAAHFPTEKMYSNHACAAPHQAGCSHLCMAVPSPVSSVSVSIPVICSCPQSLVLHEDGRTCSALPACGPDDFTCTAPAGSDKVCIPSIWRCDGQNDCPDASDEVGCPICKPHEFRCQTGQCIDMSWVCDGISQCPDNYDESQCCEFQCLTSGVCIPHTAVCDGYWNCADGSDEALSECTGGANRVGADGDSNKSTFVVSVVVIIVCVMVGLLGFYFCRRRIVSANNVTLNNDLDDSAGDSLSPKPSHDVPKPICPLTEIQKNGRLDTGSKKCGSDTVCMSELNGSTTSSSYERCHITGASSSTGGESNGAPLLVSSSSSSVLCYPHETLNPPPSLVTTADSNRKLHHNCNEDYCCSSSGASSYRSYRHYQAINQPPPPTPCSTDICDESDTNYHLPIRGRQRYCAAPGSEYDSDPFPPPPTPRSHYHSDGGGGGLPSSCSPSPSTVSTCFNPLPPSPGPSPGSSCDC